MQIRRPDNAQQLPPKTPGNHRWILVAVHTIPHSDVIAGHSPRVGADSLIGFSVGCADCALERKAALGAPCLATPDEVADVDQTFST